MKQWYGETIEHIAEYLNVDRTHGLTDIEAERRLKQVGHNELTQTKKRSPLKAFLGQFADFMVIVLIAAAVISLCLGEMADAITILAIIILNAILGFVQEFRAERSLEALKHITAPEAVVCRGGQLKKVPARVLVPGDIVHIHTGDIVPADIRLAETHQLEIQEAALTGESEAVRKTMEMMAVEEATLGERKNMAFMGTVVTKGQGIGIVVDSGMESEMGKIAGMLQHTGENQTPLQKRLAHMGKWLVLFCLVIVAVVVATGILNGEEPYQMFLVGVSLAVAAIPEGLPAIVTVALAVGVQRMLKENAIIRKLPAVETLGCATMICSDKTGTLTQNAMTVSGIYSDGCTYEVTGQGYQPEGEIKGEAFRGQREGLHLLLQGAMLCNNAKLEKDKKYSRGNKAYQMIGEPTEGALLTMAMKGGLSDEKLAKEWIKIHEVPFDSQRKRMSVVCENKKQQRVYSKGAPDWFLTHCHKVFWQGQVCVLTEEIKEQIITAHDQMASEALRVLAFAYKDLGHKKTSQEDDERLETELILLGLVGMIDPPREEALKAVQQCHQAGIKAVMITGDHKITAEAIAKKLNIYQPGDAILTGEDLEGMNDKKLSKLIERVTVYARVTPEHKLRIVNLLKENGHIVAMTGDGINDAPAIKAADIGIAMGKNGTDVTKEASDMVLSDDNFATIVSAVREGRGIYDNIRKFIRYLLSCNIGEVLTMFVASLMGMPIPLLPIQILWVNLVTDGLPAMALSVDPIDKEVMNRSPREPKESIFAHGLAYKIIVRGMLIGAAALIAYILGYYLSDGSLLQARTMAFTTLVFSQLFHVFDCRSEKYSVFEVGIFKNKYLLMAVACSALMQLMVIYSPFFQNVFQTEALGGIQWCIVLGLSGGMTILFGCYRLLCRIVGYRGHVAKV